MMTVHIIGPVLKTELKDKNVKLLMAALLNPDDSDTSLIEVYLEKNKRTERIQKGSKILVFGRLSLSVRDDKKISCRILGEAFQYLDRKPPQKNTSQAAGATGDKSASDKSAESDDEFVPYF